MPVALTDDGVSIAYRVHGCGPRNLVFLHGWAGSGSYFDGTIEHLDLTAVRAISLDMRGHGESDKPDTELTLDRLAADVFAVADDAQAHRFVAVGFSMGGKLAQYLPLVDPSRVEGVVLVASPSAGELPLPAFVAAWADLAGDAEALLAATVIPYLHRPVPDQVLQRYGENAAKIPRAYLERTLHLVSSTSFIDRLGSIGAPAMVAVGAHDPFHSTEGAVVRSWPNARVESLDCGAEIPIELPTELARALESFLASLP